MLPEAGDSDQEPVEYGKRLLFRLRKMREEVKGSIIRAKEAYRKEFDRRNKVEVRDFKLGDQVLVWSPQSALGTSKKMRQPWGGPYVIRGIMGNSTYLVTRLSDGKHMPHKIHANRLKLFIVSDGETAQQQQTVRPDGPRSVAGNGQVMPAPVAQFEPRLPASAEEDPSVITLDDDDDDEEWLVQARPVKVEVKEEQEEEVDEQEDISGETSDEDTSDPDYVDPSEGHKSNKEGVQGRTYNTRSKGLIEDQDLTSALIPGNQPWLKRRGLGGGSSSSSSSGPQA